MLKLIGSAALAALAFVTPVTATNSASVAPMPSIAPAAAAPVAVAPVRSAGPIGAAHSHSDSSDTSPLAPGQGLADYHAWLARSAANRESVREFRDYLDAQGLGEVIPVWQLIRTSSSWRQCGAGPFEVAPRDKWANITTTLRFVRDEVTPAVGAVEALSVYRNEGLNRCSNGAPASAHRLFFALDLTPASDDVSRAGMVRRVCAAHAARGGSYNAGLGFYSGRRFHVDSHGYRKWGANGRGASSPCVTGIA